MLDPRHYAFLRAINVGGRRLTNDELIEPFVRAGFADVKAYQAAGNFSFRSGHDSSRTEAKLETALEDGYGFETVCFVRGSVELRTIVDSCPFSDVELAATEGRVQIAFLRDEPDDDRIAEVGALVPATDRVVVSGREMYWLPEAGISTSDLPVRAVERLLGPMTIRTLGTVERMLAKFAD